MPTATVRDENGEHQVEILEHGLISMHIMNQTTGEIEHLYSRFEVVEGRETREQEIFIHRRAMTEALERRGDDFMPVQILPLDNIGKPVILSE